ncbi:hypothetical protein [Mucilaginibacter sp. UR6-11]|uniref:hypothetical protein n=1 Tax=Mucilaginibacter sp. UR6-11 TaxID=1435644 RepID=UPI001E2F2AB5|nr:hypothetical protein [Mucilaginibacter sp. UR6-11]MCC8425836.1 hypothetical protein [Mucilaginibacter sp. UR6-11]
MKGNDMGKISLPKYEELKKLVLINANIAQVLPSECRALSDRVFKKNGNRVSETTFKRIYGFAYSKYSPSLFTLNVLAKYCNYKGWDDFCEKQDKKELTSSKDFNWQLLRQGAHKITEFTLRALKNKSGIPYGQTINRAFIDFHFDEFIKSGRTGTVLAAPAGYGKTIALCQWVEKKIEFDELNNTNDIILLFSSNAIMSVLVGGRDIHDWMLALLGYNNDIDILLDIRQRGSNKFYFIIDGLDEHMFKSDHFKVILNQLIDIFSFYKDHDWFKLVLVVRTATWINNRHELETGDNLWHTGFKKDDGCINVPLFNLTEMKLLCHQIQPGIENLIAAKVIENFNHPLYFQFYYQQHKNVFFKNSIDHLSFYETVSAFILKKVYLGNYSTEKILLIKNLVEKLNIKNEQYKIDKPSVNDVIKKYNHAYQELLSVGFVRELNESNEYLVDIYIVFGNNEFMDHSIAKTLLYDNSNLFDGDLINAINKLLINNEHKVNVIKWCVIHAIKSGQLKSIEYIIGVCLSDNEKSELITFLGEVLDSEYSSTNRNESLIQYFKHSFSEKLFDYFFGLELINSDYKKFLHVLLKFELSDKKKILIYSTLSIIAIIQLELNDLEMSLTQLKAFPKAEFESFSINPINCLDAVYYHLKYGIIKTEALSDLTKLYFNSGNSLELNKSAANDLLYLLGSYTLLLANNPKKTLRFISFLKQNYRTDNLEDQMSQYGFFLKILTANAYFELGERAKVEEIYDSIAVTFKKNDDLLTPYMKVLFYSLKIRTLINTSKENLIAAEMKNINNITSKASYKFLKIYISSILLKSPNLQNSAPEFYKQVNHDFNKIIGDCELNARIFLQNIMIKK